MPKLESTNLITKESCSLFELSEASLAIIEKY